MNAHRFISPLSLSLSLSLFVYLSLRSLPASFRVPSFRLPSLPSDRFTRVPWLLSRYSLLFLSHRFFPLRHAHARAGCFTLYVLISPRVPSICHLCCPSHASIAKDRSRSLIADSPADRRHACFGKTAYRIKYRDCDPAGGKRNLES